jgi:hypothetical protein
MLGNHYRVFKKGKKIFFFWGQQRMLGIIVGVAKRVLKDARKNIKLKTFAYTSLIIVDKQ